MLYSGASEVCFLSSNAWLGGVHCVGQNEFDVCIRKCRFWCTLRKQVKYCFQTPSGVGCDYCDVTQVRF